MTAGTTTRLLTALAGGELSPDGLRLVVETLDSGEPVALPTETVYGLAADASSPGACRKIFEAKERPLSDPLIVHVPGARWLEDHTLSSERELRLAGAFWPGPLTIVVPKTGAVPALVTAGQNTVAVRQSAHPVMRQVLDAFGKGLAAPSANRFGRVSPTTAAHVMEELGGRIPLVVDGGPCPHGIESTIVRVLPGGFRILRRGPIGARQIAEVIGGAEISDEQESMEEPVTPGGLPWHYAPSARVVLFGQNEYPAANPDAALLVWSNAPRGTWRAVRVLCPGAGAKTAAARFYAALRELDATGAATIFAQLPPEEDDAESHLRAALREKLEKASARPFPCPNP